MKKLILLLLGIAVSVPSIAQNDFEAYKKKKNQQLSEYSETQKKGLEKYKEKANQEYANRMKERWDYFQLKKGLAVPESPDPVVPPVFEPEKETPEKKIPKEVQITGIPKVVKTPKSVTAPKQELPKISVDIPKSRKIFDFYGSVCTIQYSDDMVFKLKSVNEAEIANAWGMLSNGISNQWLNDCMTARINYNLCDWAYFKYTEKAAESIFGKSNEATLLQAFTMIQSGYKMRLGKVGEKLCVFMPSEDIMYSYSYVPMDGLKYYAITDDRSSGVYIFDATFPEEHLFSLSINQPNLTVAPSEAKVFKSRAYSNLSVELSSNKNLIDFYNEFPRNSSWELLSKASLSESVKGKLYPVLREQVKGKSQEEAANILINFVQTAFKYQTDGEQFGYERPLFGDELFFYPYSDCEDRSILYSILVREILKLDVVFLHYEGHLATAVKFTEDVKGDYLTFEGDKYLVCDPTYINAHIGLTMPQYVGKPVSIIKI